MNPTIIIVLLFVISMLATWMSAKYYYMNYYQTMIDGMIEVNNKWVQHSIEHEAELRQLATDMGYKVTSAEIIGEAICESEDVVAPEAKNVEDSLYNKWIEKQRKKKTVPNTSVSVSELTQENDTRIPGSHQC